MALKHEKVRVRREDLERALEDNAQQKRSFLDLESGEIVSVFLDMVERNADQTAKRIASGINTRYFLIPNIPARETYQEMERFIESVGDQKLAEELRRAIEGEGAFRKFRDALFRHRMEQERWMTQKNTKTTRMLDAWLEEKSLAQKIELY